MSLPDGCAMASRDSYASRQARKAQRIADQALAAAPPVGEMTDADLLIALRYYQGRKARGPKQERRLQDLKDESNRRKKCHEITREIQTAKRDYPWDDQ